MSFLLSHLRFPSPRSALRIGAVIALLCADAGAQGALHEKVDAMLDADQAGPVAATCSDADFLRRVWLDLAGMIPAGSEAAAFLDDKDPARRVKMVDRVLALPEHPRHFATTLDLWLMERRAEKHVPVPDWKAWILASCQANKPWNQFAAEILGADGTEEKTRAAARFILAREAEPNALTRDTARMFFGMDVQCAQCHDHPRIADYHQFEYHGLLAFFGRTSLHQPDEKKPALLAEQASGEQQWKSVFTKLEGSSRPRLPGAAEIFDPEQAADKLWVTAPDAKDKNVRPVPAWSRREQLAKAATDGSNPAFRRNIANRLWAHMMGRGLVEPVDYHHSGNPPSHPALLAMLAEEIAAMKFDMRAFLRELALTKVYQRSIDLPGFNPDDGAKLAASLAAADGQAKTAAEAAQRSAEAEKKEMTALLEARAAVSASAAEVEKTRAALADAEKAAAPARAAVAEARKKMDAKRAALTSVADAASKTKDACTKLPEDAELAKALVIFTDKSSALGGEAAAAEKELNEKTAAAQPMEDKVAQAAGAVKEKTEAVRRAGAAAAEVDGRTMTALNAARDAKTAQNSAARRREHLRAAQETARLAGEISTAQARVEQLRKECESMQQTASELPAVVQGMQESAARSAGSYEQAAKMMAEADAVLVTARTVADTLAAARTAADAASAATGGDKVLADAAVSVKASHERVQAVFTAAETKQKEAAAAASAAAETMAATKRTADEAAARLTAARARLPDAEKELAALRESFTAEETKLAAAREQYAAAAAEDASTAGMTGLSPEQLCWSMLQASGQLPIHRAASEAEFDSKNKPAEGKPAPDAAARAKAVEQILYDKLKGNEGPFVSAFGSAPASPQGVFFATVDQALFLQNAGTVRSWLSPGDGTLTKRCLALADPAAIASEMWLSILTRRPDEGETARVAACLAAHKPEEKAAALQDMAWALLTSAEFRFRH